MVFSNDRPEVNQLAHNRLKIFSIEDEDLVEKPISQSKLKHHQQLRRINKYSTNFNQRTEKGPTYIYDDEAKSYTLENENVTEESSGELEKDCSDDEQVDENNKMQPRRAAVNWKRIVGNI